LLRDSELVRVVSPVWEVLVEASDDGGLVFTFGFVEALGKEGGSIIFNTTDEKIEPVEWRGPVDSEGCEPLVWQVGMHSVHVSSSDLALIASTWASCVQSDVAAGVITVLAAEGS